MSFNTIPCLSVKDINRFNDKIDIGFQDQCWEWQSTTDGKYGTFGLKGKAYKAHRIAYLLHNKSQPDIDKDVCHSCDNPPCVNPNHLFLGTRSENLRDMHSKGRWVCPEKLKGDKSPYVVHSDKKIRKLIFLYKSGCFSSHYLGERYGVPRSLVYRVIQGIARNSTPITVTRQHRCKRADFYLNHKLNAKVVKNTTRYGYDVIMGDASKTVVSLSEIYNIFDFTDKDAFAFALTMHLQSFATIENRDFIV